MKRLDSRVVWEGHISTVRMDRVQHDDGEIVEREVHGHPGAVAIVAHDERDVWLVRQPREPTGEPALLEIPAGKLDVDGEQPLQTAKRELAEEIGKAAASWSHLASFYTTPGFSDEILHLYLATGLSDEHAEAEENERIEIVTHPLTELDALIGRCKDAKTLVGLLWLARLRASA